MKKWNLVLIGLLLLSITRMSAQEYYMTSPIGYGRAATGGGNATPVIVTTSSQLSNALTASGSGVILIQGSIQVDYLSVIVTNKTILGLPGSKLFTNDQTAGASGILNLKSGTKNVIIRNVTFVGPGAYDSDGRDCLTFDGATDCWVDHCDFQDGMDGNFDNKGNTDNITVSWCKFSYNKPPKAGGSGGTDDHRFTDLVGSNASDYPPSDTQYSITWQYCWWAQGCVERQVRARNAQLHMLNCFWNSSVAKKCLGLEDGSNGKGTQCYLEGGVFETPSTTKNIDVSYGGTPDVTVVDCVGNGLANNSTTVAKPSYSYTALSSSLVKAALTGSCGAGATLNITTAGVISSSCDGGQPPVAPTLALQSGSTSQSVTVNTAISNIVYSYGGGATGATVTGLPSGVSSAVNTTAKTVTIIGTPTSAQTATYTVSTVGGSPTISLNGTITSTSVPVTTLAVPTNITASATQTSATINWGAVANATGYTVNFCNGGTTGSSNVVLLLNSTTATSTGVYTLNTGDQYKTTASISTSSACSPAGYTNTYRSGSINVNSLKLVNTTGVTKLTIGAKSSGSTVRNLVSYSINGGAQITSGITQSGIDTCGEYIINGLNLTAGQEISFLFDANVQISYFIASAGTSSCTETAVTGTSFTANGLTANTSYTYQIKATNSNSGYINSAYSNAATVTTANTTVTDGTLVLTSGSDNQSIVLGSSIASIVYTYGGSTTGATVTGLPSGVSFSVNTTAKTVTISGTPTSVQAATYTVTTSQSSGNAASLSGTITSVAPATLVLTSGSANQSIVLGSSIASIVYTYGGSATGVTVTGLPSGVSSSVDTSAKTVTISGTPTSAQAATYTITTSQSSGNAASLSGTITTIAPASLALTSGSDNQSIVLGSSIASIVYTYSGSATGATVTGLPSGVSFSVNTTAKTVTISGTPTSVQAATYTVTTSQSSGNAASLSGTITTTTPAPATLVLTSGSDNQSILLGSSIASIVYTYGGSATGTTVTGLPSGVSFSVNTTAKTVTISGTPASAQAATYTVTTSQSSGNAASLSGTITTVAPTTLAVPSNITASTTQTSATISWDTVANATGYTVNICSGSTTTSSNVVMLLNSTSATSAGVYTLNTGDQYKTSASISTSSACAPAGYTNTYRSASINSNALKLVNTTGVSALVIGAKSGGASVRNLLSYTINGGAQTTTGITQSGVATCGEYAINGLNLSAGDEIAFVFDGNVQISYFNATVGTTGGVTCTETNVTGTSYTATGLTANTSVSYQVKATSTNPAYLNSGYSTVANITTSSTARYAKGSKIDTTVVTETENSSTSGFQCYPTLVENEIQISLPATDTATITIFDLTGRQLLNVVTKERNTTLNLSSLAHGVYIVFVSQNENIMQQRIIKK